tara:strand:- start:6295 stop:7023 length:729 start_codon:yes stop_codon:yes gene_type:complete
MACTPEDMKASGKPELSIYVATPEMQIAMAQGGGAYLREAQRFASEDFAAAEAADERARLEAAAAYERARLEAAALDLQRVWRGSRGRALFLSLSLFPAPRSDIYRIRNAGGTREMIGNLRWEENTPAARLRKIAARSEAAIAKISQEEWDEIYKRDRWPARERRLLRAKAERKRRVREAGFKTLTQAAEAKMKAREEAAAEREAAASARVAAATTILSGAAEPKNIPRGALSSVELPRIYI